MSQELQVYQGKVKFNDTATNPGKGTKRFFGQIEMKDTEGDVNSYQMISFRSQVISQSENLGKNGMSGKNVKVKGVFEQNTYNGNTSWQLKVDELYIEGMETLAETIKESTEIQLPKKPSDVMHPTNPVAPLEEVIPNNSINMPGSVMPVPGAISGGYIYNPVNNVPTMPNSQPMMQGNMPGVQSTPGSVGGGGYVYNPHGNTQNVIQSTPANMPGSVGGGYVYQRGTPIGSNQYANNPTIISTPNAGLGVAPPGFIPNQTNNPTTTQATKSAKELHKLDDHILPRAKFSEEVL